MVGSRRVKGARRATGVGADGAAVGSGALAPGQRWSASRKRDVVLRLLRGESLDAVSREVGVEVYRLEAWKTRALAGHWTRDDQIGTPDSGGGPAARPWVHGPPVGALHAAPDRSRHAHPVRPAKRSVAAIRIAITAACVGFGVFHRGICQLSFCCWT